MNRAYRNMMKICRWIFALPLALLPVGCDLVYEDLPECPPEVSGVRLSLAHQIDGEEVTELPIEQADFFIFDSQNKFVCSLCDMEGPFTAQREYDIPLPAGTYTILNWANLHDGVVVSHDNFIPGETTLDEVHIRLDGLSSPTRADNLSALPSVCGPTKHIYHGMEEQVQIVEKQTTQTVINLGRNTKEINLAVRYRHSDGTLCDDSSHKLDAWIRAADGILSLDNSYFPMNDAFLLQCLDRDDNITGGFNATFYKRTLRLNEPIEPELILTTRGDCDDVIYRASLREWLLGTGYNTQQKLDDTHEYLVELNFTCAHGDGGDDDTYLGLRIFVNGWEYVPMKDDL